MNMRHKIAALVGVASITTGGLIVATAGGAHAATNMTVIAHETNFQTPGQPPNTFPGQNGQPPAPGDRFFIRDDLTQDGTLVGFANVACTFTFNDNAMCTGVLALNGRGD